MARGTLTRGMVIRPEDVPPDDNSPDSWNCIDCGVNTMPGAPKKADVLENIAGGVLVLHTPNQEVYTVHDKVWRKAGSPPGCLCVGCIEARLGRRLTRRDFVPGDGLNLPDVPASERLRDRRGF